jgi:hypothetical protein
VIGLSSWLNSTTLFLSLGSILYSAFGLTLSKAMNALLNDDGDNDVYYFDELGFSARCKL